MEEDEREGVFGWRRLEEEDVAVREQAVDEAGAWRGVHGEAEGAEGDFAVVADADGGAEAPDEAPPRAGRRRAELGAVFCEGLRACGVGSRAEFAVDFVGVGVGEELVEEGVGGFEGEDVIGGEQWWEALLPVVVAAFDFAFGLGSGGVAQGDAIEVEGFAELGEGVRSVGEEEGVVVHVEGEREAVGEEDAGEEIEVGEEGLPAPSGAALRAKAPPFGYLAPLDSAG